MYVVQVKQDFTAFLDVELSENVGKYFVIL
jgi:hypothetical protein